MGSKHITCVKNLLWTHLEAPENDLKFSLGHKLKFSHPYIFATWWCKPLIFQTSIIWSTKIQTLKFLRSTTLGCRDIGIRKNFVLNYPRICTLVIWALISVRLTFNRYLYNKTRHSYIYIYIAYNRPNGLTEWAEFFCGHLWLAGGCFRLKKVQFFFLQISFYTGNAGPLS